MQIMIMKLEKSIAINFKTCKCVVSRLFNAYLHELFKQLINKINMREKICKLASYRVSIRVE